MGVKTHYLLQTNGAVTLNMGAYLFLKKQYIKLIANKTIVKEYEFKPGGWRKNMEGLFVFVRAWYGPGAGKLSRLKTCNPYKDKLFRAYLVKKKAPVRAKEPKQAVWFDGLNQYRIV